MTILSNIKKTQLATATAQQQQNVASNNNENETQNTVLTSQNSISSAQLAINSNEVQNESLANVNTVKSDTTKSASSIVSTENVINNNVTIQTNSQSIEAKLTDKAKKNNENESKTVNIQINDIQTVAPNNILKLNEPLVIEASGKSNDDSDNNNDSDSDFDFLNKTDNQISDDDEDSDLNTHYKQNLINQQILHQQQLYLKQQQQLQLNHNNENMNILTNANQIQNTRKKLTKKKGNKSHKMNLLGNRNTVGIKDDLKHKENNFEQAVNSEDEYENRPVGRNLNGLVKNSNLLQNVMLNADTIEELEAKFSQLMKEKKGFIIKPMKEDGACLFRAVSDQVYGDEEMHSTIRSQCMDYIAKNADYFKQYMTEEIDRYLSRKRQDTCHGNHIEIIAIAEIYNRPIEVYEYSIEPKNTFQSAFETDNEPIRLSYHGRNHYNSVVNPYKATIGVGLGLPQLTPGLAEKNLMNEALKKSEEFHLEKKMLDDKMKATDWEATNEEIMELVARESYMQWLKDNEKRNTTHHSLNINNNQYNQIPCNASCSTWGDQPPSVSHSTTSLTTSDFQLSSNNCNQRNNLHRVNSRRASAGTPPHSPSQSKLSQLKTSPKQKNEPHSSKKTLTTSPSTNLLTMTNTNTDITSNFDENIGVQQAESQYQYYESANELGVFGLGNNDWLGLDNQSDGDGDSAILARVLAASQQEYLESLKAKRHNQHT